MKRSKVSIRGLIMGKYQPLLLHTGIWFLLFCLPVSAFGADKVTLQLIWKNQFQFAGYYVTRELGFYDDASGALCIY
jgi:ABC-type nitrate/sulfonate/bicarbonate transport system substrate-binding protein